MGNPVVLSKAEFKLGVAQRYGVGVWGVYDFQLTPPLTHTRILSRGVSQGYTRACRHSTKVKVICLWHKTISVDGRNSSWPPFTAASALALVNTDFQIPSAPPAVILTAAHLKEGDWENCFCLGRRKGVVWQWVSHLFCLCFEIFIFHDCVCFF